MGQPAQGQLRRPDYGAGPEGPGIRERAGNRPEDARTTEAADEGNGRHAAFGPRCWSGPFSFRSARATLEPAVIALTLLVCLHASPDACRPERVAFDGSLMSCTMYGQAVAAEWI